MELIFGKCWSPSTEHAVRHLSPPCETAFCRAVCTRLEGLLGADPVLGVWSGARQGGVLAEWLDVWAWGLSEVYVVMSRLLLNPANCLLCSNRNHSKKEHWLLFQLGTLFLLSFPFVLAPIPEALAKDMALSVDRYLLRLKPFLGNAF